ncbi:MAG: primosomal protein N' [Candidatus Omnitrophota bacterium]|nr:primosomal protein N' [Candidatus Omnitrophota bacterium]
MKRNIANVVVGLPIETIFDYLIPDELVNRIKVGCRVWVPFREKRKVGYIVGLNAFSSFKKIKWVISLIDEEPIFDKDYLRFLKNFNTYYSCSLGEAIETSLPIGLKSGMNVLLNKPIAYENEKNNSSIKLIQDFSGKKKWEIFFKEILDCLRVKGAVIFLVPEVLYIPFVLNKLKDAGVKDVVAVFNRKLSPNRQAIEWQKVKNGVVNIAIGTRSAIFAPFKNLKLIIIDEEDSPSYKQQQMPFYHARDVALMRAKLNRINLILASPTPSIEIYHLVKKNRFKFLFLKDEKQLAPIKVIDMARFSYENRKRNQIISLPLEIRMRKILQDAGKVIIFINRKGFSNIVRCKKCNLTLKCSRCNASLTYHFDKKKLLCRFCNYQIEPLLLCPNCNASYMRYSVMGTETLESEASRLFPDKKVRRLDKETGIIKDKFDILISTQMILKSYNLIFADLIGVVAIDSALNRLDFRAAEKTFSLLIKLSQLAKQEIIVQTHNPKHYSILSAAEKDFPHFYKKELRERRSLGFPPFRHFIFIMVRGKRLEAVKNFSFSLHETLKRLNKSKDIEIYEPLADIPDKLRGSFRWQILIKGKIIKKTNQLIKNGLRLQGKKSGIIVVVNVDI